jgi:hypothetical protein
MGKWKAPFHATLFNEAVEPHDEIWLRVCPEKIVRNGSRYRLIEFSRHGAVYVWCVWPPGERNYPTVKI